MVSVVDESVGNVTKALKSTGMWENSVVVWMTDKCVAPLPPSERCRMTRALLPGRQWSSGAGRRLEQTTKRWQRCALFTLRFRSQLFHDPVTHSHATAAFSPGTNWEGGAFGMFRSLLARSSVSILQPWPPCCELCPPRFVAGTRVPGFVSGGLLPAQMRGTTLHGIIHITDYYNTFATLAGVDPKDTGGPAPIDVSPPVVSFGF